MTLRETVRKVLGEMGTRPRKRLGQHFMVNPASLDRVAAAAALTPGDTVVEIGAGLGFLTECLAATAGRVVAIEKDKWFCDYLRKHFEGRPNVEIVEADALEFAFNQFPASAPAKCAGNIPYQISSPLLERLERARGGVCEIVLTIQREFALRLAAKEGTKDRSALSAWMQLNAGIELLSDFALEDFYPPPRVLSSLVRVRFFETPLYPVEARDWVRRAITAGFGKKRKNILNALAGSALNFGKPELGALLKDAGIDSGTRAEDMSGADWARLGARFAAARPSC